MTEKKKRGFAVMSPEKRREISSKGGKSVPPEKRTYCDKEKAAVAGRRGGFMRGVTRGGKYPKPEPLTPDELLVCEVTDVHPDVYLKGKALLAQEGRNSDGSKQ
jgi:general stress protein YciG